MSLAYLSFCGAELPAGLGPDGAFWVRRPELAHQRFPDVRRHERADIPAQSRDLFNDARAQERVSVLGHHKDGLNALIQFTVHQRELEFKLKVRNSPQPPDYGLSAFALDVLHQQAIEGIGADVGE